MTSLNRMSSGDASQQGSTGPLLSAATSRHSRLSSQLDFGFPAHLDAQPSHSLHVSLHLSTLHTAVIVCLTNPSRIANRHHISLVSHPPPLTDMSRSGRRRAPAADSAPIDLSQDDEDVMPLSSLASLARSVKREEYKDSIHTQPNNPPPARRARLATQAQRDRQNREDGSDNRDEEKQDDEQHEEDEEEREYEEKQQPASPSSPPPLSPSQPGASSSEPPACSTYFNTVSYHQLASTLSQRQQHNAQLQRALQQSTAQLAALQVALPSQLAQQLTADHHAAIAREHAVSGGMRHALEVGRVLMEAGEVSWQTRWEDDMRRARDEGDEKGRPELQLKIEQADRELADRKLRLQRERDREQQRQRDREQGGVEEEEGEEDGEEADGGGDEEEGEEENEFEQPAIILPLSQSQPQAHPQASGRARSQRR